MKILLTIFSVTLAALIAVFGLVNPYTAIPLTFLPIIGLIYAFSSVSIMLLIILFLPKTKLKIRLLFGFIFGFTPTIIFALLTLSNLSPIDLLLAVCLPLVVAWYATRVL